MADLYTREFWDLASAKKSVIVESPFRGVDFGDRARNVAYLIRCLRDCIDQGEAPFASHLACPQFLNEDVPEEREAGIMVGLAWAAKADQRVFYTDRGWSTGMKHARNWYDAQRLSYELRTLADGTYNRIRGEKNSED